MKNITLSLFFFGIFISMSGQTFNTLTNPASGDGQIIFNQTGFKGYLLKETSMRGYNGQILSFQYFSPGIGSSLLNFVENSVVIGDPVLTNDNLYVNGSSAFGGNVHFYDDYSLFTLNVDPKSFFNNVAVFNSNVGINVQNPQEKLHIDGAIRGGEAGGSLRIQSSHGALTLGAQNSFFSHFMTDRSRFYFNKPITIDSGELSSYGAVDLKFHTNYNLQMIIKNSNGYVGIGTANPDEKLTVKGSIHAEEVKVDLLVPADYVFQKYYTGESSLKNDYIMPTLEEVEAFTKANNHLPDIPSAEEIQKSGLKLKEMTNLLLQKIEELTLYTIEQEKRIKILEMKLDYKN